jgi:hypothetical protein
MRGGIVITRGWLLVGRSRNRGPQGSANSTILIRWYRFLDWLQSTWNISRKTLAKRRRWGAQWRDKVRPGRQYSRVEEVALPYIPQGEFAGPQYRIRPEPGWEWWCPNCKEYSLITESMMPEILKEWNESILRMTAKYHEKGVKVPAIPPPPTPATAGCPNCKYRPGAPE